MRLKRNKSTDDGTQVTVRHGDHHDVANVDRDFGFGSVVASESRQRLLNRDGTFNVRRTGLSFWQSLSLYHLLLNISWTRFLCLLATAYVAINIFFGFLYSLCGAGALEGPDGTVFGNLFLRSFFFSVETFSTIGYGNLTPRGFAPNLIVTVEAFTGILVVALSTGIIFARFSRPTAKIIYSERAVIAPYRDKTAFMFRITNARMNSIMDLHATVMLSKFETINGRVLRQFFPLRLERERVVFFPLSWTLVHPIDEESPLYGLENHNLVETDAEILVTFKGLDETFSQTVHSRSSYKASEIVWNAKFGDIYDRNADSGLLTVDIRRLHNIEHLG